MGLLPFSTVVANPPPPPPDHPRSLLTQFRLDLDLAPLKFQHLSLHLPFFAVEIEYSLRHGRLTKILGYDSGSDRGEEGTRIQIEHN